LILPYRRLVVVLLIMMSCSSSIADEQTLIMGIFPRYKVTATYKSFTPLADYLGKALGKKVIVETTADYASFINELNAHRYDIVHFNQYHYVRYHNMHKYNVIAMNEESGKSSISGSIVVSKNSEVRNAKDLRQRKIVFGGGPDAMMSYIIPTFLLNEAGLNKDDYTEEFAKSPMNALLAVHFGHASAAGVGDAVLSMPMLTEKYNTEDIREILVSEPLAHLPWAVKDNMHKDLVDEIRKLLVNLRDDQLGKAILTNANLTAIVPANDADYDRHREIIRRVLGEAY